MAIYEVALPNTQIRHWLGDKVERAHDEYYYSFGVNAEMIDQADRIANSVADLFDIELIESADYGQDYYDRCDNYVFGRVLNESWFDPRYEGIEAANLWFNSILYLLERGFQPLSKEGEPGDVVLYGAEHGRDALHFGIYEGEGKVVSKFSMGPLVRHPIELVPSGFGEMYLFLRKEADSL